MRKKYERDVSYSYVHSAAIAQVQLVGHKIFVARFNADNESTDEESDISFRVHFSKGMLGPLLLHSD